MRFGMAVLGAMFSACGGTASNGAPEHGSSQAPPPFVGQVWTSTDPSAALGTMRIFLPDGTLVMDSCWETYRLAEWQPIEDGRIGWHEDGHRFEAEVTQHSEEHLHLRFRLAAETREETYRLAEVPYVCPDMPR